MNSLLISVSFVIIITLRIESSPSAKDALDKAPNEEYVGFSFVHVLEVY